MKQEYPFCPGCSHSTILDAIKSALKKLNTDPKKTVLVSDIGCLGMADKYFDVHTFHGLHGRSFTYASGIKIANPDLNVFVLVGDGGCGIGGHHLINAARKNIGIKVICFNNFNFGMTGGEHSVTTPLNGKTSTTPFGNLERPLDLCQLVISAGAGFVARKTGFDKDLSDTIVESFHHKGFSFIDVMELCSAYYMPMNDFKKPTLEKMIKDMNLNMGLIKKEDLPEYSIQVRKLWKDKKEECTKPKPIKKKFEPLLKEDVYSIVLAGSAGEKIVSSGSILAKAVLACGMYATQQNDYPVTVQTGHSLSEIKISKQQIYYPCNEKPNALIIISEDGLKESYVFLEKLEKTDIVIASSKLKDFKTKAKKHFIDLSSSGLTRTNKITATISYLLKIEKIIPLEALKFTINNISKEKIKETNLKAFEVGQKLIGD